MGGLQLIPGRYDLYFNTWISEMELNKSQKNIYYFVRYSLMLHPFIAFFIVLTLFIEMPWDESLTDIGLIVVLIPIFISFIILPGIIYKGEYKYAFYGFGKNQFKYNLFLGITLGFGPVYIFFKKYDPILKEHFRNNRQKS
jgi:hypothetical protein